MSTLIEKLEATLKSLQETERGIYMTGFSDGYELALKDVKQHSEWISVDERLPSVSGHYPCCFLSGDYWHQHVDFFDKETKKFSDDDGVRWWYDLPKPPIEVQP